MALKILFADDSMTAQNMGKKILTDAGYEVIAVSNGAAAAKKLADKPDIIIVDVFMPGYSGLEICQKVRAAHATAKTPVILTVGKMEPYKPEDGAKVKADGVVIKPFEASDLLAVVQKFADRIALAKPADYEKTIRMKAPIFEDTGIQEELGTVPVIPLSIPSELSSTPAIGYDELGERPMMPPAPINLVSDSERADEHPAKPAVTESAMHDFEAIPSAPPLSPIAEPSVAAAVDFDQTTVFQAPPPSSIPSGFSPDAHEALAPSGVLPPSAPPPAMDSHYTPLESVHPESVHPESVEPASTEPFSLDSFSAYPDPMGILNNLEASNAPEGLTLLRGRTTDFMASSAGGELEATLDPPLKSTVPQEEHFLVTAEVPDPALITDPTEAANAFPTRFGIEDPEEVPVGIAADVPGLYADSSPSSEAPPPPGRPQDEFEAKLAKAMAAFETSDEDESELADVSSAAAPAPHLVVSAPTEAVPHVSSATHAETSPPVVAVPSPIPHISAYGAGLHTAAADEVIAEAAPASKIALVPPRADSEAVAPVSTDQDIRISESSNEDVEDIMGSIEDTQSMGVPTFEPLYGRTTDFSHLEPIALRARTPEPPHPVATIENATGIKEAPHPDEPSRLEMKISSPFVDLPHPLPLQSVSPAVDVPLEGFVKQSSPVVAELAPLSEVRPPEPVVEPVSPPPVVKLHEPLEETFFDPIIEEPSVMVIGQSVEPLAKEPSHFLNGESAHFALEKTSETSDDTYLTRAAELAVPVSTVEATASAPSPVSYAASLPHAVLTDAEVVSEAVSRAMEQFVPELIATITRELEAARSKR